MGMIWDKRLHPHSLSFPGNLSFLHSLWHAVLLAPFEGQDWDAGGASSAPPLPSQNSEPSEGDTGYKKGRRKVDYF